MVKRIDNLSGWMPKEPGVRRSSWMRLAALQTQAMEPIRVSAVWGATDHDEEDIAWIYRGGDPLQGATDIMAVSTEALGEAAARCDEDRRIRRYACTRLQQLFTHGAERLGEILQEELLDG